MGVERLSVGVGRVGAKLLVEVDVELDENRVRCLEEPELFLVGYVFSCQRLVILGQLKGGEDVLGAGDAPEDVATVVDDEIDDVVSRFVSMC